MKKSKHTPEQIIRKLRDAEAQLGSGATVPEVCKAFEISEATFYRWKREYGGMQVDQLKRLKALEKENARLKRLVAEQALDNQMLKEIAEGNCLKPGAEASRSRASPGAVRSFRASGLSSGRPAEIDAAPAAPEERGRSGAGRADEEAGAEASPVWLPPHPCAAGA
jgi:putative transposase